MGNDPILFSIFLIFTGAALLATVALLARQALLVAYILLGVLLGPSGAGWLQEGSTLTAISHVGVIFLLFLLGLNLHPQRLLRLFRQAAAVTVASSLLFGAAGWGVALLTGLGGGEALVVGVAMTFSSTILGVKLLPTTALHHQRAGEVIISVLLLQDLLAILALLLVQGLGGSAADGWAPWGELARLALALPLLVAVAHLLERFVVSPLIRRFDRIQEYIFLMTVGWCLGLAELASWGGLSAEIGAFLAGVALARSPLSTFIAETLKPLRDFFLVIFFFTVGAAFDVATAGAVWLPGVVLAGAMVGLKPLVFRGLLRRAGEPPALAGEIGIRLGQISEFSLLIVAVALESRVIGAQAAALIQLSTLLAFVASSYWIVLRLPTPIAVTDRLRRD